MQIPSALSLQSPPCQMLVAMVGYNCAHESNHKTGTFLCILLAVWTWGGRHRPIRWCWRLRWSEPEAAERGIPRLRRTHPSHAAQARLCPFVRAHARKLRSNERQCVLVRLPLTVDTPSVPRGHHEGGVGGAGHAGSPASPPPHRCRRRCRRGCCPTRRSRPPPRSSDRAARRPPHHSSAAAAVQHKEKSQAHTTRGHCRQARRVGHHASGACPIGRAGT